MRALLNNDRDVKVEVLLPLEFVEGQDWGAWLSQTVWIPNTCGWCWYSCVWAQGGAGENGGPLWIKADVMVQGLRFSITFRSTFCKRVLLVMMISSGSVKIRKLHDQFFKKSSNDLKLYFHSNLRVWTLFIHYFWQQFHFSFLYFWAPPPPPLWTCFFCLEVTVTQALL